MTCNENVEKYWFTDQSTATNYFENMLPSRTNYRMAVLKNKYTYIRDVRTLSPFNRFN